MSKSIKSKLLSETAIVIVSVVAAIFVAQAWIWPNSVKDITIQEVSGTSQVFYGDRQLTSEQKTHATPVRDGDYAAWVTESDYGWQVWLAHLPSNSQIELLRKGNNVNPQIRGRQLVWEAQVNDIWQIMWFDGVQIRQISEGNLPKQHPRFVDSKIIYEERDAQEIRQKEYVLSAQPTTP